MSLTYLNDLLEIVQSLDDAKASLKDKKIFITGGTGFLGVWLVDALVQLGAKPTLLTRNKERAISKNLPWIEGNLKNLPELTGNFDEVIHAANDLTLTSDESLASAKKVFDFAKKSGAKRVLFLSSGAAYQTEKAETNAYIGSKLLIEKEGTERSSRGDFEFKIARCFAFIGPHQDLNSHFAATQFFKDLIDQKPLTVKGDGNPVRSFLYPTDFMVGVIKILLHGRSNQIYNLGSNEAAKIIDLANLVNSHRTGEIPPINVLNQDSKSLSQTDVYLPDMKLTETELNFHQKINLKEAVKRTAKFYQEMFPNSKIRVN